MKQLMSLRTSLPAEQETHCICGSQRGLHRDLPAGQPQKFHPEEGLHTVPGDLLT